MDALHVRRLDVRYRLPRSRVGERRRLGRILEEVLDSALEAALERLGVPLDEEICLRELHLPISLRLALPARELRLAWSLALAAGIRRALDEGGAVRYRSLETALVDFARGVAAGDLRRAWAWRQLGLAELRPGFDPGSELAAAMVQRPAAIVPVLVDLAERDALGGLARRLEPAVWPRLATAAAGAATPAAAEAVATWLRAATATPVQGPGTARVERALGDSAIARGAATAATAKRAAGPARDALAVLALLEVERGVFYRPAEELVGLLSRAAATLAARSRAAGRDGSSPGGRGRSPFEKGGDGGGFSAGGRGRSDEKRKSPLAPLFQRGGPEREGPEGRGRSDEERKSPLAPLFQRGGPERKGPEERDANPDAPATEPAERRVDPHETRDDEPFPGLRRQRGVTEHGGLLFLLGVLDDLGLPAELAIDRRRSLRFLLHRLALELAELDPRDPAALAFAGLGPETEPPDDGDRPLDDDERDRLRAARGRIVAELRRRLGRDDLTARELTFRITRRDATVYADPGWIEVELALGEVSTEIRRAGLDLDPGYLPWLGVAIRFHYR